MPILKALAGGTKKKKEGFESGGTGTSILRKDNWRGPQTVSAETVKKVRSLKRWGADGIQFEHIAIRRKKSTVRTGGSLISGRRAEETLLFGAILIGKKKKAGTEKKNHVREAGCWIVRTLWGNSDHKVQTLLKGKTMLSIWENVPLQSRRIGGSLFEHTQWWGGAKIKGLKCWLGHHGNRSKRTSGSRDNCTTFRSEKQCRKKNEVRYRK